MTEIIQVELGHINLRGDASDNAFTDGVAAALGQPLPPSANTISRSEHRIYWLGPDEWHVVTDPRNIDEQRKNLEQELRDQPVAINDLSGGQIAIHLRGAGAAELLAKGCTLDLHPSVFPVDTCAQSGLAKTNVLLGCIDETPTYEVIVRRSFSEYALCWLRQN